MPQLSFRPDVFELDPPCLLGTRCGACGGKAFPPRQVCPHCGAVDEAEPTRLTTIGSVYSFTVIRQAPPGLQTPYVLAYVDLDDDDVRVMARLEGSATDEVAIGMPVELTVRDDERAPEEDVVMFAFQARTTNEEAVR